jgi:uncharacterized protein
MSRTGRIMLRVVALLSVLGAAAVFGYAWLVADFLISAPVAERPDFCATGAYFCEIERLAELGLEPETIEVVADDGVVLSGLFLPSTNGAAVIVQHGYRGSRAGVLHIVAMLHEHGYGVLAMDLRGHGASGGETISFGRDEARDLDRVFEFLAAQDGVQRDRIGMYGWSLGGAVTILHAARNTELAAAMVDSPFDAINTSNIAEFTDMRWPLPSLIGTAMALQLDLDWEAEAPIAQVAQISPRPLYIMVAGADRTVDAASGDRLFEAAGEPKQRWYEPELDHVRFSFEYPERFETEMLRFFDRYLLEVEPGPSEPPED